MKPLPSPSERILRIAFGALVVPFFAGLAGLVVRARYTSRASPAHAAYEAVLVAVLFLFALLVAYGLDQFLTGLSPHRTRWFTAVEKTLDGALLRTLGRGSLKVARLWGAEVRVHWSLLVGVVVVGLLEPGAWTGFLITVIGHELGHAVLVRRFGLRLVDLSFHALGGECRWAGQPSRSRRAWIAWGGVAAQALIFVFAFAMQNLVPALFTGWFGAPLGRALVYPNLVMAAFNLLPFSPLDGFEAWRLLFPRRQRRRRGDASRNREDVKELVQSALDRAKEGPR